MNNKKMNLIKNYLKDIWNIVLIRIKLLCANKKFVLLYMFFIVITASIMLTFSKESDDKSSIPIGVVDLDNTVVSKSIIDRLNDEESIRIIKGSREELLTKLEKGELSSVFVYEKGFADKLSNLDTNMLISHTYSNSAMFGKILSDIVLSPMLDDVCYLYCKNQYYINDKKYIKVSNEEEYEQYFRRLYKNETKKVAFNFKVISEQLKDSNKLKNQLLYLEVIIGICAVILTLVTMIIGNVYVEDYIKGVHKRLYISTMKISSVIIGDFLASLIVSFGFGTLVSVILFRELGVTNIRQIIKLLLLILALECTISMLFILLSRLCKDFVAYQLIGSICVLVLGISGAIYILGFLVDKTISSKLLVMPIATLINGYKNIVVDIGIGNNLLISIVEIIVIYILAYMVEYKNRLI